MSFIERIRTSGLAAACSAAIAVPVLATPLAFEPGETLDYLQLARNGDDVVVSWQHGLAVIDPATLAVARLETAAYSGVAMETGEYLFYYRDAAGNPNGELRSLRERQTRSLGVALEGGLARMGERLLFASVLPGQDVWASDGTPQGTQLLADPVPGWTPQCGIPCLPGFGMPMVLFGTPAGKIFFVSEDGPFGVPHYTVYLREAPASFPGLPPQPVPALRVLTTFDGASDSGFLNAGGRLLLEAVVEDGQPAGLFSIGDQPGDVRRLASPIAIEEYAEAGAAVYFLATGEPSSRLQLWRTDGVTADGAVLVLEFDRPAGGTRLWTAGNQVYFKNGSAETGPELWTSDGSAAGTRLLAELRPGPQGANPAAFRDLGDGRFVFTADDGVHGREPWISDGTPAGTRLLEDARPGPLGSDGTSYLPAPEAGRLFFAGLDDQGRRTPSYVALPAAPPSCPAEQLCLQDGRFRVEVAWIAGGQNGVGKRATGSNETGIFTFFSPDNWELMVKVLDGCGLNQHFWVFAAAATDVHYEILVTDTRTGEVRTYVHPGGAPARATADIEAFATCAAGAPQRL